MRTFITSVGLGVLAFSATAQDAIPLPANKLVAQLATLAPSVPRERARFMWELCGANKLARTDAENKTCAKAAEEGLAVILTSYRKGG